MMPKMDGFGVLEELKKLKQRPVVFVNSNLSQAADKDRAMKLGADAYLVKSDVSLKEIVEKITKALK
jgi:DNA-binding NarL/FixJ family response regulator